MNLKLTLAALLMAPLALAACANKDEAPKNDTAETVAVEEKVTPEQQAVIDSIDQPVLDEKNTDIPAAVSNVDADAETPAVEEAASNATTH